MTVLDAFLDVDLEAIVPCEVTPFEWEAPCANEAEWKVVFRCCGTVRLICDEHKQELAEQKPDVMYRCTFCHTKIYMNEHVLSLTRI